MKLILNYIAAFIVWVILITIRVIVMVLGIFIVPIALPFAKEEKANRKPVWEDWKLIRLPRWAWPWDNARDGCLGDRRGQYWYEQRPEWMHNYSFIKKFNWLAIRNPANNFSRFLQPISVDVADLNIYTLQGKNNVDDEPGKEGFRFAKCVTKKGVPYWGLFYVSAFKIYNRNIVIRLGHKLDPMDNDRDWPDVQKSKKGITFRIGLRILG